MDTTLALKAGGMGLVTLASKASKPTFLESKRHGIDPHCGNDFFLPIAALLCRRVTNRSEQITSVSSKWPLLELISFNQIVERYRASR